jgi:hypothetical protein
MQIPAISRKKKAILAALAASATIAATVPAWGLTISLDPDSQSISSGGTATWGAVWLGAPGDSYNVSFLFGDGTGKAYKGVTYTSKGFSHGFFSCQGQTYDQLLAVHDIDSGASARATATTNVAKGACLTTAAANPFDGE